MKMFKRYTVLGFTIIELLISMTVIGLLVSGVIFGFNQSNVKAKCSRIKQDFDSISKAATTHREVTGNWATDVNMGVAPAFVPEFLIQWPNAEFYQANSKYDWETWPPTSPDKPIKSISLRASPPRKGAFSWDEEYYYCVQDDQATPTYCNWSGANPPTALNVGGTCP